MLGRGGDRRAVSAESVDLMEALSLPLLPCGREPNLTPDLIKHVQIYRLRSSAPTKKARGHRPAANPVSL